MYNFISIYKLFVCLGLFSCIVLYCCVCSLFVLNCFSVSEVGKSEQSESNREIGFGSVAVAMRLRNANCDAVRNAKCDAKLCERVRGRVLTK